jgi:hypothetical protein
VSAKGDFLRAFLGLLGWVAVFFLVCGAWTAVLRWNTERHPGSTVSAGEKPPTNYPVLVIAPGPDGTPRAEVVLHKGLAEYVGNRPDFTYLVPAGREAELRAQVRGRAPVGSPSPFPGQEPYRWKTDFRVLEPLPGGRQLLEVTGSEMVHFNVARYEAADKAFTPRTHKFGWYYLFAVNGLFLGVGTMIVVAAARKLGRWIHDRR